MHQYRSSGHRENTDCVVAIEAPAYGQYYVYSSGPRLSHVDRPKRKSWATKKGTVGSCTSSHATNIRTKGAHDCHNMMWEPTVYRGSTSKTFQQAELDRFKKKRAETDCLVRKRKSHHKHLQKKVGGIVRPATPSDKNPNGAKLIGFGNMGLQTEQFLEEVPVQAATKDTGTQANEITTGLSQVQGRPFAIGLSIPSQTDPSISYSFEENVTPVQTDLCKKILEQSLLETTEESEMECLRKETRAYVEWRSEELFKCKRIVDAQRAVAEERALALERRQREARVEEDAEDRLGAALFSSYHLAGIMPDTFSDLRLNGQLSQTGAEVLAETLVPWMNSEITADYDKGKLLSRNILDDLLQTTTTDREIEAAMAMWDLSDNQTLRYSSGLQNLRMSGRKKGQSILYPETFYLSEDEEDRYAPFGGEAM